MNWFEGFAWGFSQGVVVTLFVVYVVFPMARQYVVSHRRSFRRRRDR